MFKRLCLGCLVLAACALSLSGVAFADTVSNPNDGFGSSYTLTDTCNGSDLCTVTLAINSTGATLSHIDAVAFKIGTTDIFTVGGTLSAPIGSTWTVKNGSLNSGGSGPCGTNGNGQSCTFASSPSYGATTGGLLTWTWTGVQVDATNIGHVGYQYNNGGSGPIYQGKIISCDYNNDVSSNCANSPGTPPPSVSEPGAMALLGAGFIGLAGLLRRRLIANPA
jgi:hypothetical protein